MRPKYPMRGGAVLILFTPADEEADAIEPKELWANAKHILVHSDDVVTKIAQLHEQGFKNIRLFDELQLTVTSTVTVTIKEKGA